MTDNKLTRAEIERSPERYRVLESGAVMDLSTGKIVTNLGGPYTITKARSQEMHARRKELGLRSRMRGLARGAGIEIADDMDGDDLIVKASDGLEALTAHLTRKFLASENVRGMSDAYSKLAEPFALQMPDEREQPFPIVRGLLREMAKIARSIDQAQLGHGGVDVDVIDADEE